MAGIKESKGFNAEEISKDILKRIDEDSMQTKMLKEQFCELQKRNSKILNYLYCKVIKNNEKEVTVLNNIITTLANKEYFKTSLRMIQYNVLVWNGIRKAKLCNAYLKLIDTTDYLIAKYLS